MVDEQNSNQKVKKSGLGNIPIYLGVALLVLGLALGFGAGNLLLKSTPCPECKPTDCPTTPAESILDVIFLYDSDCKICAEFTTTEKLFEINGIKYNEKKVDVKSEEGKALVVKYDVFKVPTILVATDSVSPQHMVKYADNTNIFLRDLLKPLKIDDKYVVTEMNHDPNTFYASYVLEPSAMCSASGGKPRIDFLMDPYGNASISQIPWFNNAVDLLKGKADIKYAYTPTTSVAMFGEYDKEIVEQAIEYYMCADKQGKLREMQDAAMGIYCDKTKDEQANDVELQNCAALNERIGIPLSDIELNRAAKNANLDINALNSCIKSESKQLVADSNALSASFQLGISPIAIVDCKYIVNILNAASSVCDIHPDVEGCSALVPVSDINAEE